MRRPAGVRQRPHGFVDLPLAVPAGMVVVYALIVAILVRARSEFSLG